MELKHPILLETSSREKKRLKESQVIPSSYIKLLLTTPFLAGCPLSALVYAQVVEAQTAASHKMNFMFIFY